MSYMLEFPPHVPLPAAARSPPYVLFGIRSVDYFSDLPSKIPLALVLHFSPKLKQYILPVTELSTDATYLALRTPYVGINILADISIVSLAWIVNRMLLAAGIPVDNRRFLTQPNIQSSVSIHEAWIALELPVAGIQALHIHLQTKLIMGAAVTLKEMKAIWSAFPAESPIVLEMGLNFVRSHIHSNYSSNEFSAIKRWCCGTHARSTFFRSLESRFPKFSQVQELREKATSEDSASRRVEKVEQVENVKAKRRDSGSKEKAKVSNPKRVLSHSGSSGSLSSVKTVVWDPPASLPVDELHSIPIDNLAPLDKLEDMVIEDGRESEPKVAIKAQPSLRPRTCTTDQVESVSSERVPSTITGTAIDFVKKMRIRRNKATAKESEDGRKDEEKFHETVENAGESEHLHPTTYRGQSLVNSE
jgi:hypothetical protein